MAGKSGDAELNSQDSAHSAETNFSGKMSYSDYLGLDKVLTAQQPQGDTHDELLFIIQHQTSELWMKLALHELNAARQAIRDDSFRPAFKMLARVAKIFEQLNNAWDVLRTMTPSEYTSFRDDLAQSSGFQSYQYRLIEFTVGNRNKAMLKPHAHRQDIMEMLKAELQQPSLYDEVIQVLARRDFDIASDVLNRNLALKHSHDASVEAAWKSVYESPEQHWTLYELAEKLVDF